MAKKAIAIPVLLFCLSCLPACGDDFFRYEAFGAYSFMQAPLPTEPVVLNPVGTLNASVYSNRQKPGGFKTGLGINLNRFFGIIGEFGWNGNQDELIHTSFTGVPTIIVCVPEVQCIPNPSYTLRQNEQSIENYTFLAGPRISAIFFKRLRPFGQILTGMQRKSFSVKQTYDVAESSGFWDGTVNISVNPSHENSFAISSGGGLDLKVNKRFSIRLFEIEAITSRESSNKYTGQAIIGVHVGRGSLINQSNTIFSPPGDGRKNKVRLSFGAVFHFGAKMN
jgi:hypothetical protein